jgi:hypothetical protein
MNARPGSLPHFGSEDGRVEFGNLNRIRQSSMIDKKGDMMNTTIFVLVLSVVVSGCFSSTLITPTGEQGGLSYAQFNERMGNDGARIVLSDGQSVSGEGVYLSRDSLFWVDPNTHSQQRVPTEHVRSLGTVNHLLGGLVGVGLGAAAGLGIGLKIGEGFHGDRGAERGIAVLLATPSGALLGGMFGALIGWPSRYEFQHEQTTR